MGTVTEFRPVCVNYGCGKPVAHDGCRYRPVCSHCQKASYGGQPYAQGVRPYRTGRCTNRGQLGFECPVDYEQAPWAVGVTEIDHRNGNHMDNRRRNLQELCPMCHKQKGRMAGDYSGFRYARRAA